MIMFDFNFNKSNHYWIVGDSLEVLKKIKSESIDLICTDPPYNIGISKWDHIPNYLEWLCSILKECKRVLKSTGTMFLMCAQQWQAEIEVHVLKKLGFNILNRIVWHYTNGMRGANNKLNSRQEVELAWKFARILVDIL